MPAKRKLKVRQLQDQLAGRVRAMPDAPAGKPARHARRRKAPEAFQEDPPRCPGCGKRDRIVLTEPFDWVKRVALPPAPFCERCCSFLTNLEPSHGRQGETSGTSPK